MPEYVKTTPRTEKRQMVSNAKLQICIGEKGGICVYGLARFPVTLYFEQWETLLGAPAEGTVGAEILAYGIEFSELLGEKPTGKGNAKGSMEFTLGAPDIALVAAETERLLKANDFENAVKFAAIKQIADSGRKVSRDQMILVLDLGRKK